MTPKATDAVIENIGYWKPNEQVSVNVIRFIRGTAYAGYYLICNTAGTTGSTEPKPTAGTTALVSDGSVKWYLRKMISSADVTDSTITGKNITVTKSTQGNITPSGNCKGDWAGSTITNLVTVTAGIGAGTYTLKNLLQQLVNKSHGHSTKTISLDCNCDCDCGDSTCIVSGSVKTDNGYKPISELEAGDLVFNGEYFEPCVGVVDRKVGKRNCITIIFNGNIVAILTADHPIKGDNDTVLVADKDGFLAENETVFADREGNSAGYFLNNEVLEFKGSFEINGKEYKAVKTQLPKETKCYLPVLQNGGVCYLSDLPVYTGKEV